MCAVAIYPLDAAVDENNAIVAERGDFRVVGRYQEGGPLLSVDGLDLLHYHEAGFPVQVAGEDVQHVDHPGGQGPELLVAQTDAAVHGAALRGGLRAGRALHRESFGRGGPLGRGVALERLLNLERAVYVCEN